MFRTLTMAIAAIALATATLSPAAAGDRHHYRQQRQDNNAAAAFAIIGGAAVLFGIIASQNNQPRRGTFCENLDGYFIPCSEQRHSPSFHYAKPNRERPSFHYQDKRDGWNLRRGRNKDRPRQYASEPTEFAVFRNPRDYDGRDNIVRLNNGTTVDVQYALQRCRQAGANCRIVTADTWQEADDKAGYR